MRIKKSLRDFLFPFLIGYLLKEVVEFVNERGFAADHQLAKCLFFIIMLVAALLWLWTNDEIENVKIGIEESAKKMPIPKESVPTQQFRAFSPAKIISYKLKDNIEK